MAAAPGLQHRCQSANEFGRKKYLQELKEDEEKLMGGVVVVDGDIEKTKYSEFSVTSSSSNQEDINSLTKPPSSNSGLPRRRPSTTTICHSTKIYQTTTFIPPKTSKQTVMLPADSGTTTLTLKKFQNSATENSFSTSCSSTLISDLPILKKIKSDKFYHKKSVIICEKNYKIGKEIGRGGSSRVYEAKYKDQTYAIKVVDLENESESVVKGYIDEVKLLEKLQNEDEVIKMESYELKKDEDGCVQELLVVMEKGENDFQTFLRSSSKSPNLIRYYWELMLNCVRVVHNHNIVHSDLKPANFIFVKNKLKLIDFGIASAIATDKTSAAKDCQSGTLNYMSPESIHIRENTNKVHVPLAADVWSLGCILYSMVYGEAPFARITVGMKKMAAITDGRVEFKPIEDQQLLEVMKLCLRRDFKKRPTVSELLQHPYLKPHTVTFIDSGISSFCMSLNDSGNEESIATQIAEDIRNNTPRTAAQNVIKMIKSGAIVSK